MVIKEPVKSKTMWFNAVVVLFVAAQLVASLFNVDTSAATSQADKILLYVVPIANIILRRFFTDSKLV